MDIRDYIKIADAFGTETKKLAELKEGELADRIAKDLGWDQEDAEEIEKSVDATGNNPAELADIMTDGPAQPVSDPDENEPLDSQDSPNMPEPTQDAQPNTTAPAQPETPASDEAPQVDTNPPAADPDATDPRGDQTNPPAADPDATDPRGDQTNPPAAPQTDAENDADSADSGTPTSRLDTKGETPAPQTDAELDADSADNAPQGDSLANRLDTQTPSLLDAYNDGGRQAMDSVRDLQTGLSRLGFDPNGVDGKYGRGTYAAVQEFQRQNGLTVDGEAGPTTMAKLQELLNARSAPQTGGEEGATQSGDAGDGTRGGDAPQTDAENDADSTDSTGSGTGSVDPDATDPRGDQTNPPAADPDATDPRGDQTNPPAADPDATDPRGDQTNPPAADPDATDPRGDQTNPPAAENPVTDKDISRIEELLRKADEEAGQPDAERDGRERGIQTASTDFSMLNMLKLMESLTEALTQDERAELDRLIKKLQGSSDPRSKKLLQQYNSKFSTTTTTRSTGNKTQDVQKIAAQMRAGTHPIVKKAEQMLLNGAPIAGGSGTLNNYYMDAIRELARKSTSTNTNYQIARADLNDAFYGYFNKKYMGGSDTNYSIANSNRFWKQIQSEHGKQRTETPGRTDSQGRIRADFSWDNNITDRQPLKESIMSELDECGQMPMPQNEGNPVTMSVTLNASGEENVKDLVRMMQLAGAKDAAPVADMHVGPVDKHDDMVNMMRMMDTPEESVEEEWDNAPEEDYRDHKHMTKDLSGGLNREKKAYAKAQDGDNAMAVESIKSQLLQALEEKGYNK